MWHLHSWSALSTSFIFFLTLELDLICLQQCGAQPGSLHTHQECDHRKLCGTNCLLSRAKKQLKKGSLQALKHKPKFSTGWCPAHSNLSRCEDLMLAARGCAGISPSILLLSLPESKTSSCCCWGHGYSKQSWLLKIQKTICPWNRCSCPPLGKKEINKADRSIPKTIRRTVLHWATEVTYICFLGPLSSFFTWHPYWLVHVCVVPEEVTLPALRKACRRLLRVSYHIICLTHFVWGINGSTDTFYCTRPIWSHI